MKTHDLCTFLMVFSVVVSSASVFALSLRPAASRVMTAVVALAAVLASASLGARAHDDANVFDFLLVSLRNRNARQVIAVALGFSTGLVWLVRPISWFRSPALGRPTTALRGWLEQGVLSSSIAGVVLFTGAYIWQDIYRDDRILQAHEPEFVVEEVARFDWMPIRVALGDKGEVFVSLDDAGNGFDLGMIVGLKPDPETGRLIQRTAAISPLLYRPYGLTYKEGALYVSRSGHLPRAVDGKVTFAPAGSVAQLKDLDGDGYYEYCHDVVTGLPGSGGPDPQHQNNDLVFGTDGSLYVANGVGSDRAPGVQPWEGTILRVSPNFAKTDVFARGFRNPFGLCIGPGGTLFGTDNDVDENPGDEINHILPDEHYGHPFVIPGAKVDARGFRAAIHVGTGISNYTGIAYTESSALPERLRGCLYVADPPRNLVHRFRLSPAGDSFKVAEATQFASIPSPVDLCIAKDGDFYVLSRYARKLYRVRRKSAQPNSDISEGGR